MQDIQALLTKYPLIMLALYELLALLGMLVHFLKQDVTGQTAADVWNYFIGNFKYTLWATITTVVFAGTAWYMDQGLLSSFLTGYAFDSMLNRGPGDTLMKVTPKADIAAGAPKVP